MADLSDINSSQFVKIAGSNSSGIEQNFITSTVNGSQHINLRNDAGTEVGITATPLQTEIVSATTMAKGAKQDTQTTALNTLITNIGTKLVNKTVTGTIASGTDFVEINCEGYETIALERTVGTIGGAFLSLSGTTNAGTTTDLVLNAEVASTTAPFGTTSSLNATHRVLFSCAGWLTARVYCTGYTSGSCAITMTATKTEHREFFVQAGRKSIGLIKNEFTSVFTYSASITGLVPAALATDIFEVRSIISSGSTKTRITRVEISATQTTGAVQDIQLIKRSTANSGGTSTTVTGKSHDSAFTSSTSIKAYTANPTLGTGVVVRSVKRLIGPTTSAVSKIVWDFATNNNESVMLTGTVETLCINLNGATWLGGLIDITVEFVQY